jgi:hypothetical protein
MALQFLREWHSRGTLHRAALPACRALFYPLG